MVEKALPWVGGCGGGGGGFVFVSSLLLGEQSQSLQPSCAFCVRPAVRKVLQHIKHEDAYQRLKKGALLCDFQAQTSLSKDPSLTPKAFVGQ